METENLEGPLRGKYNTCSKKEHGGDMGEYYQMLSMCLFIPSYTNSTKEKNHNNRWTLRNYFAFFFVQKAQTLILRCCKVLRSRYLFAASVVNIKKYYSTVQ